MNKKFIWLIVVIIIFVSAGIYFAYVTPRPQPQIPLDTGADMIKEEDMIRVLFPRGGETLEIGSTYEIRWENYLGKKPLMIVLQVTTPEGKGYARIIGKNVPAATEGVYSWTVNSEQLGSKYKIEIYPSGMGQFGRSKDYFSITGEPLITVNTPQMSEAVGGIMLVPSYIGPPIIKGKPTPIKVTGQARRIFNEGEFVVKLRADGIVWDENIGAYRRFLPLDEAIARAKTDDWMTGEWTDFEAELSFTAEQVKGKTQFGAMIGFYPRDGLGNGKLIYEFPVTIGRKPVGITAELIVDYPVADQTVTSPIAISGRVREGFIKSEFEFRVNLKGYRYRLDHPRYLEGVEVIQSVPIIIGDRYWCDWTNAYWHSFTATIRYDLLDYLREGGFGLNFYDVGQNEQGEVVGTFSLALPVKLE